MFLHINDIYCSMQRIYQWYILVNCNVANASSCSLLQNQLTVGKLVSPRWEMTEEKKLQRGHEFLKQEAGTFICTYN